MNRSPRGLRACDYTEGETMIEEILKKKIKQAKSDIILLRDNKIILDQIVRQQEEIDQLEAENKKMKDAFKHILDLETNKTAPFDVVFDLNCKMIEIAQNALKEKPC